MKGRLVRGVGAVLVSVGLLALLLSRLEIGPAVERFRSVDATGICLAALFSFAVLLLRAVRFSALTRAAGIGITAPAVAIQVFLNRITPFRLGELSLPLLLKRHAREAFSGSLLSLFFVRLLDLGIVVCAIALALATGPDRSNLPALVVASLLLLVLVGSFRHWMGGLVRLLAGATAPLRGGRLARLHEAMETLSAASREIRRLEGRAYAKVAFASLGIFLGQTAMFGAILLAYDIRLPLLDLVRGGAVAQAGAALPIAAVGTIGTQEASWVAGFAWVGLPLQEAIVTGIATQLLTLGFAAVFALPAWIWLSRRSVGLESG